MNMKPVSEIVDQALREKQQNKTFQDSDIRVGGARKEQAMLRKLTRIDLEELENSFDKYDIATILPLVKKDMVFPEWDIAAQKELGVSSGALYYKVKIREAFPGKPKYFSEASLKVFTGLAAKIYDTLLPLKTLEEVVKEVAELRYIQVALVSLILKQPDFSSALDMMQDFLKANKSTANYFAKYSNFFKLFLGSRFDNAVHFYTTNKSLSSIRAYNETTAANFVQAKQYEGLSAAKSAYEIEQQTADSKKTIAKMQSDYVLVNATEDMYELGKLIEEKKVANYDIPITTFKEKKKQSQPL